MTINSMSDIDISLQEAFNWYDNVKDSIGETFPINDYTDVNKDLVEGTIPVPFAAMHFYFTSKGNWPMAQWMISSYKEAIKWINERLNNDG